MPVTELGEALGKDLSATVREVLGTTQSVGATVDGRPAHDVIESIISGETEIPSE